MHEVLDSHHCNVEDVEGAMGEHPEDLTVMHRNGQLLARSLPEYGRPA